MSAKRYNWFVLKEEFITSKYLDVAVWARNTTSTLPVLSGANFKTHTKGWGLEKLTFLRERGELTIQKVLELEAEANAVALVNVLKLIQTKVTRDSDLLNVNEIYTLWKVLRVENGLPIKIADKPNSPQAVPVNIIIDERLSSSFYAKSKI